MHKAVASAAAGCRDLRLISAAMKMITDMERIGDQAADISEIVIHLSGMPYIKSWCIFPLWPMVPSTWFPQVWMHM